MNILITGGSGFLGSHLCNYLLENEDNIEKLYCIDNNYTGTISNISELLKNDKFIFIEEDIVTFNIDYFKNINIEQIYHLACPASPKAYQKQPIETMKTSVIGTLNMLNLAKEKNATILFTSTSEIYGDPLIHPQKEEYWGNVNPIGIRSCYDEGKRCGETLMMDYLRSYNTKIKIARLFNTYGPYMDKEDGRVVSNFINQIISNQNITLYGDGSQTRSFCYVDDTICCLHKLMNSSNKITGPINIGNPNEISVKELANIILDLTDDSTSKIIYEPLPQDDPKLRKPDIFKANKLLEWKPKIELKYGLMQTIMYFKKIQNVKKENNFEKNKLFNKSKQIDISVIMGSDSDLPIMKNACEILDKFNISYECTIVSAHRTPERMFNYAKNAYSRGIKVIIAGAGGAAHLPGMIASITTIPVIGVPIKTTSLNGEDSLLSIVQMPKGVPVATVGINNSINAGLLSIKILACKYNNLNDKIKEFMESQEEEVLKKAKNLEELGHSNY